MSRDYQIVLEKPEYANTKQKIKNKTNPLSHQGHFLVDKSDFVKKNLKNTVKKIIVYETIK